MTLVVSLEQAVAAPLCSRKLADFGARVIKVERPEGDFARQYDRSVLGQSTHFVWLNRGKQSICLDLRRRIDLDVLLEMAQRADVFLENLRPGSLLSLGIDLKELRAKNARLITCSIVGYGEEGLNSRRKAYDLLIQAECGLAAITGSEGEPARAGISVVDIAAGVTAYEAILEALLRRSSSGMGEHISVSLFSSISDWMGVPLLQARHDRIPARVGLRHPTIAPYGVFTCFGGDKLLIAVQNNREWAELCRGLLKRPDLGESMEFRDNSDRVKNRASVDSLVQDVVGGLQLATLVQLLDEMQIAYGVLNDPLSAWDHPHLRCIQVETPEGKVAMPAPGAVHSSLNYTIGAVPRLDEHALALRAEFSREGVPEEP